MVFVGKATASLSHNDQLKFRPNYQVMELHTHPHFDMEAFFLTHMYDLALIKLNQTIIAGKSICLPESSTALDPNLNEYGIITGWGVSDTEGLRIGYTKIQYVKLEAGEFELILQLIL